jgi:Holliday junction resolvase YEN1
VNHLFQNFTILFQLEAGLKGCGWKTARLLAQSELAKSLFLAASESSSQAVLEDFLCDWRSKFLTLLMHDPQNILGRSYPSLAKDIIDTFPSVDVVFRYAQPLTSWTIDRIPDTKSWQLRRPCLTKIATLCEKYFSWGSSGDIVSRFKETLWPGIVVRHLLLVRNNALNFLRTNIIYMQLPDPDECLAQYASKSFVTDGSPNIHILRICQERLGPGAHSTNPNVIGYTIQIATHGVLHDSALGLDPALHSLVQESDCHMTSFWIPGSILKSALPNLVKHFKGRKVVPQAINYPSVHFTVLRSTVQY